MSIIRSLLVPVLAVSLAFSPVAHAIQPSAGAAMEDVELSDKGVIVTRVVDLQGNPVAQQKVTVMFQDREIASAISDADGLVAISGLRPGVHAITTDMGTTVCRFWSEGTAPPSAIRVPAVVSDAEIVRAQFGGFNLPMAVYATVSFVALGIAIDSRNKADDAKSAVRRLESRVEALETAS